MVVASVLTHGILRLPSSKVRAASAARLVAASEFTHGQLRLPSSKVCPASWSRLVAASTPRMASCRCLAGGS
ncbi:hypothetical protein PF011_g32878 [Phytophthora fragariae]|uniref:Uncharacterized protein n=1 Tax=Phytophthora fragariae TaxID=53985 RepID=A0A6A3G059_9STRA|nr:hypothetical protein PF011_g32878 [Phytophthora fragariae]